MSNYIESGQRRRRVRLTPMRPVPVEFTGDRAGEGPLTVGQLNIYGWVSVAPDALYTILCVELPLPTAESAAVSAASSVAVSVRDVAEATSTLISRHETLRTSYVPGERPRQRVAAAGVQMLEVCSLGAGQWGPRDRPAVAEALIRWLSEAPDPVRCPVRLAVAVAPDAGDQVIACAAAFSHLAVDNDSIGILKRDFADLLGDPPKRQPKPAKPAERAKPAKPAKRAGHQPLDQAELEATPAERRRVDAALDHVLDHLRRVPRCMYAVPGGRITGESLVVELSSAAAAMAVLRVAERTRTSRSSIVLAAICAVVARRAAYRELLLPLVCSNRFERHLVNYVGSLAQASIATVEIADRSFDELISHTWMRVAEASRHARYDRARQDVAAELIEHERGLRLTYGPLFNSLVPEPRNGFSAGIGFELDEIDIALARTELLWRPMPVSDMPIRFILNQLDGRLRLDAWSGDTGLVPRAELESVLLAVERVLAAAAHGDVPGARMPGLIGLEPLSGTPGRILVDHCWVDVADVQRLVDDAVAPAAAHVFASADGRPLVACLAASDDVRTPAQAHARCMAVLTHHPTAITPRYYVICDTAPADLADHAAWPAPLTAGTGRALSHKE